jgi:hypothetical protein
MCSRARVCTGCGQHPQPLPCCVVVSAALSDTRTIIQNIPIMAAGSTCDLPEVSLTAAQSPFPLQVMSRWGPQSQKAPGSQVPGCLCGWLLATAGLSVLRWQWAFLKRNG